MQHIKIVLPGSKKRCFVVSGRYYVVSLKGARLPTREAAPVLGLTGCSQLWVVYFIYSKNYIIYHNKNKVYNIYIKDVQKKDCLHCLQSR